jgi:hypothetical protein
MSGNIKWVSPGQSGLPVTKGYGWGSGCFKHTAECLQGLYDHVVSSCKDMDPFQCQGSSNGSVCFTGYQGLGLGFRLLQTHS